jgi:Malectin domain
MTLFDADTGLPIVEDDSNNNIQQGSTRCQQRTVAIVAGATRTLSEGRNDSPLLWKSTFRLSSVRRMIAVGPAPWNVSRDIIIDTPNHVENRNRTATTSITLPPVRESDLDAQDDINSLDPTVKIGNCSLSVGNTTASISSSMSFDDDDENDDCISCAPISKHSLSTYPGESNFISFPNRDILFHDIELNMNQNKYIWERDDVADNLTLSNRRCNLFRRPCFIWIFILVIYGLIVVVLIITLVKDKYPSIDQSRNSNSSITNDSSLPSNNKNISSDIIFTTNIETNKSQKYLDDSNDDPLASSIYINAGGFQPIYDPSTGVTWQPDSEFIVPRETTMSNTATRSTKRSSFTYSDTMTCPQKFLQSETNSPVGINSTTDIELFCTERWFRNSDDDVEPSTYKIPVTNNVSSYKVVLYFTEMKFNQINQRVFQISIQQEQFAMDWLDIVHELNSKNERTNPVYQLTASNILVSDGYITIYFIPIVENPKINAIEIHPMI